MAFGMFLAFLFFKKERFSLQDIVNQFFIRSISHYLNE